MKQQKVLNNGFVRLVHTDSRTLLAQFHIKAPLFVLVDWMLHLGGSVARLSVPYKEFYTPSFFRDRAGNTLPDTLCNELTTKFTNFYNWLYNFYRKLLDHNLDLRQIDMLLPQSLFVEFSWTISLLQLNNLDSLMKGMTEKHELLQYYTAVNSILLEPK